LHEQVLFVSPDVDVLLLEKLLNLRWVFCFLGEAQELEVGFWKAVVRLDERLNVVLKQHIEGTLTSGTY
jgi:hypothetical protein